MFLEARLNLKSFCNIHAGLGTVGNLALAVVCIISLVSCGGSGGKNAIAIAAIGPLTGTAAARGKALQEAARMAVDEANGSGGVNGHRITIDVYDDGDQPDRARELAFKV